MSGADIRTVLFVHGSGSVAGTERVLLELLDALDPILVRPVVAALADGPFVDELERRGVDVRRLAPAPRLRQARRVPATVRGLRAAIESTLPDIVQAVGEKMAVLSALAARGLGVPVVAWLHDGIATATRPGALATQLALRILPATTAVVCPSEWLARDFQTRYRRRAVVIHNGLSVAGVAPRAATRASLVNDFAWPDDSVIVGFFGRLERWKGPDRFLDAAARVLAEPGCARARFVVVGGDVLQRGGSFATSLPLHAARLGLGDRVAFLGHRHDALELVAAIDVVAHCSIEPEPFGMVVVEAMALDRAVVATKTRGPEEIVSDGVDGLLVAPDVDGLATAIARLVRSASLRARLGMAARATARRRFSADRMADQFQALWSELVTGVGVRT